MVKMKVFDFLITAAALTALFFLLPADKDVKLGQKQRNNSLQLHPANPANPKLDYRQAHPGAQARTV